VTDGTPASRTVTHGSRFPHAPTGNQSPVNGERGRTRRSVLAARTPRVVDLSSTDAMGSSGPNALITGLETTRAVAEIAANTARHAAASGARVLELRLRGLPNRVEAASTGTCDLVAISA
jgi:hypothetical protein